MRPPPGEVQAEEEWDPAEKQGEDGWERIRGLAPPAAASDCSALIVRNERCQSRKGKRGKKESLSTAREKKDYEDDTKMIL